MQRGCDGEVKEIKDKKIRQRNQNQKGSEARETLSDSEKINEQIHAKGRVLKEASGIHSRELLSGDGRCDGSGDVSQADCGRRLSSKFRNNLLSVESQKMSGEQRVRQLIKMNPHPDFPSICGAGLCQKDAKWKIRSPRKFTSPRFPAQSSKPESEQSKWRVEFRCDDHAKAFLESMLSRQETVRILEGTTPIGNPWTATAST